MSTRVKIGPFKITPDFWGRLQLLPGDNDEQRVLIAVDAAITKIEAKRAAMEFTENAKRGPLPPGPDTGVRGTATIKAIDNEAKTITFEGP